ncbi:MAG: serine hydrolase domain-containing protein [Rubrivivax sp.]
MAGAATVGRRAVVVAGAGTALRPRPACAAPAQRLQRFLDESTRPGAYLGAVAMVQRGTDEAITATAGHRDLARMQPMTPDTLFRLYSLSKPIATVAVLALVADGRLTLDAPVARWLPAFGELRVGSGAAARAPQRALTLRHLLTHTAGWGAVSGLDEAPTLAAYAARLAASPLEADPGTRFAYDGLHTELAVHLAETVSGAPFDRLLQRRVLQPLAMHDTGFALSPAQRQRLAEMSALDDQGRLVAAPSRGGEAPGAPLRPWASGAGGLYGSAADLLRFARALRDGDAILPEPLRHQMLHNQLGSAEVPAPPERPGTDGEGFGLGLGLRPDPGTRLAPGATGLAGWTGASSTLFFVHPGRGLIALLLAQHLQRDAARDLPRLLPPFRALVLDAWA